MEIEEIESLCTVGSKVTVTMTTGPVYTGNVQNLPRMIRVSPTVEKLALTIYIKSSETTPERNFDSLMSIPVELIANIEAK